jgi:hypothetical protein
MAQERFTIYVGENRSATGIDMNNQMKINLYASGNTLYVKSDETISNVQITTAQGLKVFDDHNINNREYVKTLPVSAGIYIVTVLTANNETKTERVIIK